MYLPQLSQSLPQLSQSLPQLSQSFASIIPILKEKKDIPCVVIPAIPRYVFSRCCSDSAHCTNANSTDYCETLMTGFMQMRNDLIKILVAAGITNFKVLDTCCPTSCATTANTKTRIADLKKVTASDGVHLLAEGYVNLATRCQACIRALLAAPPRPVKHAIHFWRGFKSPHGSNRPHTVPTLPMRGRGGGRPFRHKNFHPYRRN